MARNDRSSIDCRLSQPRPPKEFVQLSQLEITRRCGMIFLVGWDKRQLSRAGPPLGMASTGGPALAFARQSHPTFCRSTIFFCTLLQSGTISKGRLIAKRLAADSHSKLPTAEICARTRFDRYRCQELTQRQPETRFNCGFPATIRRDPPDMVRICDLSSIEDSIRKFRFHHPDSG